MVGLGLSFTKSGLDLDHKMTVHSSLLCLSRWYLLSALTSRDFVPRLELLTLFRDFWKGLKMCKMNQISLFCKLCFLLILTICHGALILCCITTVCDIVQPMPL